MTPLEISAIVLAGLSTIGNFVSGVVDSVQTSITQRRALIANEITTFINSKTYNYKDTIFAALAIIAILGLAYITKKK